MVCEADETAWMRYLNRRLSTTDFSSRVRSLHIGPGGAKFGPHLLPPRRLMSTSLGAQPGARLLKGCSLALSMSPWLGSSQRFPGADALPPSRGSGSVDT
jgi:hypothetical protein